MTKTKEEMNELLKELEGKEYTKDNIIALCECLRDDTITLEKIYDQKDILKAHNKIVDELKRDIKIITEERLDYNDKMQEIVEELKEEHSKQLQAKDKEIEKLNTVIKQMTDDTYIRMSDEMKEEFKSYLKDKQIFKKQISNLKRKK